MLKRIGPGIDPLGTPSKLNCPSDVILSIFILNVSCHANNLRTTCYLYLIEQVSVTNHD